MNIFTRVWFVLGLTVFLLLPQYAPVGVNIFRQQVNLCSVNEDGLVGLPKVENYTAAVGPGETVKKALGDNSWLYAKSKDQVEQILSVYYCGEYLQSLTEDVWNYIKNPTDMYATVRVVDIDIIYIDSERTVLKSVLCIEDANTGATEHGSAVFNLARFGAVWKITYASYSWQALA